MPHGRDIPVVGGTKHELSSGQVMPSWRGTVMASWLCPAERVAALRK